jgi:hypothetical protein
MPTIEMKIAKASDDDFTAALTLMNVLEAVANYEMPPELAHEAGSLGERYDSNDREHNRALVMYLQTMYHANPSALTRIIFGLSALTNPANQITDPDADVIALHPRIKHALASVSTAVPALAGVYVASRVHHAARWQELRTRYPILTTWIDEAGEGETDDLGELWGRIRAEIEASRALVLYLRPGDFPLKGALIEVGMALAIGRPVHVAMRGVEIEPRSMRPVGSWLHHPLVTRYEGESDLEDAMRAAAAPATDQNGQAAKAR